MEQVDYEDESVRFWFFGQQPPSKHSHQISMPVAQVVPVNGSQSKAANANTQGINKPIDSMTTGWKTEPVSRQE
jgi:hypothetical protein